METCKECYYGTRVRYTDDVEPYYLFECLDDDLCWEYCETTEDSPACDRFRPKAQPWLGL